MALDDETSLLRLKAVFKYTLTYATVQLLAEYLQCNGGKLEEAEYFKCVFVVYCV